MSDEIKELVRNGYRLVRAFKRRQLYGPDPTPEETASLQRILTAITAIQEGDEGTLQDALAALTALIHYHGQDEADDE